MDALLVVDVQSGMFLDPAFALYDGAAVVRRIARLIDAARANRVPVIFVQHEGGPGDVLARAAPGFALHPEIIPRDDEPIVVKRFCSAFQETRLAELLEAHAIRRIGVCGMQTEYCVDATCRAAFERGFQVTLIADAHTTFDTEAMPAAAIIAHHNATLGNGFAEVRRTDSLDLEPRGAR